MLQNALIDTPAKGVGLSLEQRKRVTIGVELVARPRILFLDEATSGLPVVCMLKVCSG